MRRISVFVLLSLLAGCAPQEKSDNRVKVYPVEGKLLVLGRPAGDAALAFRAADKDRAGGHCPVGITRADGTFRLTTYSQDDGAPEGEYVITLYWPHDPQFATGVACECSEVTTHDRLFGRYADPATSQLRATVRPERNEIALHATVGGTGWNLPRLKGTNDKKGRDPDRDGDRPSPRR
ncbi:MAG: hypothetical protein J0I06_14415 [Planctomycetes bacterium]|nr:hypothetical protein [Planctomycetota bacterium]